MCFFLCFLCCFLSFSFFAPPFSEPFATCRASVRERTREKRNVHKNVAGWKQMGTFVCFFFSAFPHLVIFFCVAFVFLICFLHVLFSYASAYTCLFFFLDPPLAFFVHSGRKETARNKRKSADTHTNVPSEERNLNRAAHFGRRIGRFWAF